VPFYQRLGDVPRKRHVQFRENGTLLTEEVMGLEGFTGNESILYHLHSPCRVMELAGLEPIEREEWVPEQHAHRHLKTFGVEPGGDEITGRRVLDDGRYMYSWYENAPDGGAADATDGDASGAGLTSHL
jgi:homogentisate 1,2-dioxygenase